GYIGICTHKSYLHLVAGNHHLFLPGARLEDGSDVPHFPQKQTGRLSAHPQPAFSSRVGTCTPSNARPNQKFAPRKCSSFPIGENSPLKRKFAPSKSPDHNSMRASEM